MLLLSTADSKCYIVWQHVRRITFRVMCVDNTQDLGAANLKVPKIGNPQRKETKKRSKKHDKIEGDLDQSIGHSA